MTTQTDTSTVIPETNLTAVPVSFRAPRGAATCSALASIEARLPSAGMSPRAVRRRKTRIGLVFTAAVAAILGVWLLMAIAYGGIGGRPSVGDLQAVLAEVSSTNGQSGEIDTSAVIATPAYMRASGRPAESLGADPARELVVIVSLDTHIDALPDPGTWEDDAALDAGGQRFAPSGGSRLLFRSDHHQTVALRFPPDAAGDPSVVAGPARALTLTLPALEGGSGAATMRWDLPLPSDAGGTTDQRGAAVSLAGVLAVMAGLLLVFSPCAIHLTAVFLPLVTGLSMEGVTARANDRRFRVRAASLGLAFVAGFVLLYTTFGVLAGAVGSFFTDTTALRPLLVPVRLATGAVVVYLALQRLGLFRMPFVISLRLPGRPEIVRPRQGYAAAMIAGASVSVGCLVCVGGTLLASLLLYAGASGSPLIGGATLFLFALGVSIPFVLTAVAFDRVLPRMRTSPRLVRYSGALMAAMLLVVGLLILSGSETIFERLVPSFMRIG
jgi:cytochrome c-type biogenesis protein